MSFQNLVRLLQMKKISLPNYAHVNKVSKKIRKKGQSLSSNMMIGYDIYNEAFPIVSKNDIGDQNFLLVTVLLGTRKKCKTGFRCN
jgi:hypothetical protein